MKKKLKGLNPEVYRKAAENMRSNDFFHNRFSCLSVKHTAEDMGEPSFKHRLAYEAMFYPPDELNTEAYNEDDAWGDLWGETNAERNDCRVLALLFMAEIAKGG